MNKTINKTSFASSLIVFISLILALLVAIIAILVSNFYNKKQSKSFDTVLFITIDTLRKDHVSAYGYPYKITPFIDKLAENGTQFNNAYTVSSHTAPSHTSMFTGLYPFRHKVLRNYDALSNDIYNINKHFLKNGFKTVGFPATTFLEGKVSFKDEREKYNDIVKAVGRVGWFLSAKQNIARARAWFENEVESSDKVFMWLHLYDAHQWQKIGRLDKKYIDFANNLKKDETYFKFLTENHNIPISFYNSKDEMLTKISTYDAKIKMIDDELLSFFNFLNEKRGKGNILIVLISDHGEGLGNHYYDSHGKYLYNEQLEIPLIFWSNNGTIPKKRENALISSIDVFATVADLVNIPLSKEEFLNQNGKSYKDIVLRSGKSSYNSSYNSSYKSNYNEKRDYVISERRPKDDAALRKSWISGNVFSVLDGKYKYIYNEKAKDEFYDLQKDAFELENKIDDEKNLVKLYDKKLSYEVRKFETHKLENQGLTKKEINELKALGYL
ncbi:MAG: sulfatase [Bdellovibrionota bacterium]